MGQEEWWGGLSGSGARMFGNVDCWGWKNVGEGRMVGKEEC